VCVDAHLYIQTEEWTTEALWVYVCVYTCMDYVCLRIYVYVYLCIEVVRNSTPPWENKIMYTRTYTRIVYIYMRAHRYTTCVYTHTHSQTRKLAPHLWTIRVSMRWWDHRICGDVSIYMTYHHVSPQMRWRITASYIYKYVIYIHTYIYHIYTYVYIDTQMRSPGYACTHAHVHTHTYIHHMRL